MRIAFCLFKFFPFGGLQRDFSAIVNECLSRGHEIDIYALEWLGPVPEGTRLFLMKNKGITNHRRYWNFSHDVGQALAREQYDVAIGFNKMPYLDIYYAADPCFKAMAERLRGKYYQYTPRHHYFCKLEDTVFGQGSTAKILVIAENQKTDIMNYYGTTEDRFFTLPPRVSDDRIPPANKEQIRQEVRKAYGIQEDEFLLLMIGSGFKIKGLDRALLGIHSLPPELRSKIHFIVVGEDKAKPFQSMAEKLGISNQVKLLGGRKDVPNYLFAADYLIHPAYCESAGIVLIEALVAGLPVITTDTCGYAYHVQNASAGIVVPSPFEQEGFNSILADILNNDYLSQWQANALDYSAQQDFLSMAKQATDIIEAQAPVVYRGYEPDVQIKLRADLKDRWHGDDVFDQIMDLDGVIYRQLDGRKTLRFNHNGADYFAKLHHGVGWREIFKNLIQARVPVLSAHNEWQAIERLEQLNIDTMKFVGFGRKGKNPSNKKSFIITEALPDTISLEDYCADWPKNPPAFRLKQSLLKKVADVARQLHINGVNHRDFYICHFLLHLTNRDNPMTEEDFKLFLIDLHRVQIRRQTPLRWIVKDLGSLFYSVMSIGLTKRDLFRFVRYYQHKSLRHIIRDDARFWRRVWRRGIMLYIKAHKSYPVLPGESK